MGFLLVDANNAFNKINKIRILWTVRHLWLPGDRSIFNQCCHHTSLVLRRGDGMANILYSRAGMIQGDPFSMVSCGIGNLLLIKRLKLT